MRPHGRIIDWWQHAYVDSPLKEKFLLEAGSSLPKLVEGEPGLEDIYLAMLHQRARLKADQQLVEWSCVRAALEQIGLMLRRRSIRFSRIGRH